MPGSPSWSRFVAFRFASTCLHDSTTWSALVSQQQGKTSRTLAVCLSGTRVAVGRCSNLGSDWATTLSGHAGAKHDCDVIAQKPRWDQACLMPNQDLATPPLPRRSQQGRLSITLSRGALRLSSSYLAALSPFCLLLFPSPTASETDVLLAARQPTVPRRWPLVACRYHVTTLPHRRVVRRA